MVAKVTIDTDRWKSVTEISIDTDNDHTNSNGEIKLFVACYVLQCIIIVARNYATELN